MQLNQRWKTGGIGKRIPYIGSTAQSKSLCENCNRNQELKVQQLASFEPIVNENFDMEIENYR